MGDIVLVALSTILVAVAAFSAFVLGDWDKGTYFMANAAVLIGAVKL